MKSLTFVTVLALCLTQSVAQEAAQTADDLFKNSLNEDLVKEAQDTEAIEATRPTDDEYDAACDAKGALAAKAAISSKEGVTLEQAQAEIRSDPTLPEGLTQLGSDMLVKTVYDYMSGMSPADVSALIVKQCLIR